MATKFNKDLFTYHGGFLTYHGTYEGQKTYGEVYGAEKCHPTKVDAPMHVVVARFKYKGPITKAKFLKELLKSSISVEKFVELSKKKSPVEILRDNNPAWYEDIMSKFEARFA